MIKIPEPVGWKTVTNRLADLTNPRINHISLGIPMSGHDGVETRWFYDEMLAFFRAGWESLEATGPSEWWVRNQGVDYEHLLWEGKDVLFHVEVDCENSDEEICRIFPEAVCEKPNMYWITIDRSFLGILWAVIVTGKRSSRSP